MKLRVSRQDIVPFLKVIWSAVEILAEKREVDLTFYAEKENIPLYFDPEKIEAALCNLLMNALKCTPPGGQVKVSVRESPPGSVEISVSDTGPGIPRDQVASIFDHFYQPDGSYENQKKGFGIGLALAKEFIALHHGEIRLTPAVGKAWIRRDPWVVLLTLFLDILFRGYHLGNARPPHLYLHVVGNLHNNHIVLHVGNHADYTPYRHHLVPLLQSGKHRLVLFALFRLGSDHEQVHDDHYPAEEYQHARTPHSGRRFG